MFFLSRIVIIKILRWEKEIIKVLYSARSAKDAVAIAAVFACIREYESNRRRRVKLNERQSNIKCNCHMQQQHTVQEKSKKSEDAARRSFSISF